MFQRDLGIVEKTITDVAKQTGVMLLLDMSGANAMIAADPNIATRNLKRGLAFYLGNELEKEISTSQSNFRTMNFNVLIDDTVFNAIISVAVEQSNLNSLVEGLTSKVLDSNSPTSGYVVDAILSTGMRWLGDTYLATNPIRHVSSLLSM